VLGRVRVDVHPAYRVLDRMGSRGKGGVVMPVVPAAMAVVRVSRAAAVMGVVVHSGSFGRAAYNASTKHILPLYIP
jgi:hypothetical protein